jgi:hypothetical protein
MMFMGVRMTLSDIIRNALDREYSLDRAAADLGELMTERELIKRKGDTDTPRLHELVYVPLDTRGYLPLSRSGTKITPS